MLWSLQNNIFDFYGDFENSLYQVSFVKDALFGKMRQVLAAESFLKMMENAFNFISKALLVLKFLKFCLDF